METDYENPQKLHLKYCIYFKTDKSDADPKLYEIDSNKHIYGLLISPPKKIKQHET
jgi:hypothetical protein